MQLSSGLECPDICGILHTSAPKKATRLPNLVFFFDLVLRFRHITAWSHLQSHKKHDTLKTFHGNHDSKKTVRWELLQLHDQSIFSNRKSYAFVTKYLVQPVVPLRLQGNGFGGSEAPM